MGGLVLVVLYGVADVETASGMDCVEEMGLAEGYPVEYLAGSVVDKFELDMPTSFEVPKSITLREQKTGLLFPGPKGLNRRSVAMNSGVISEKVSRASIS